MARLERPVRHRGHFPSAERPHGPDDCLAATPFRGCRTGSSGRWNCGEPARRLPGITFIGAQPQEAKLRELLLVAGNEGTATLATHQQVLCGECVDGLSDCALADTVALRELTFTRDQLARAPLTLMKAVHKAFAYLPVKRAESNRRHRAMTPRYVTLV